CWSCAAILFALKAHGRHSWAVAAGAAFGVSVLVRPSNVLLVPGLLIALPWTMRSLGMFVAGGAPFGAIFMAYNRIAFGNPLSTGYASDLAGADLELTYFRTRFLHYGFWLNRLLTPLIPLGWIASMWDHHLSARRRMVLLVWFLPFFLFYCNYRHYDTWWYTRFLLPATPALIIGAMFSARDLAGLSMRLGREMNRRALVRTLIAIIMVLFIVWVEVRFLGDKVAGARHGERVYAVSALAAPARVPEPAYVFSMQTSGALHYYGSATPVRWDVANDQQLEALETAFASRGIGWYAILFPFEVEDFLRKMPGQWQQIDAWDHVTLWTRTDA
ncbi:MAG TPA: hypothetical protein VM534_11270, partial [Thermoanaerobaculia bacterium]|nr:hypothetical protein [Thermoanaerobaculia bacterium]